MVLEDFLFPEEVIKYQSNKDIKYNDNKYILYMTNRRVIGHKQKGFSILKKDKVFSIALEEIINLDYKEKGLARKKGVMLIQSRTQKYIFEGKIDEVKVVWQEMQKFLDNFKGEGAIPVSDNVDVSANVNTKEEDPLKILKMRLVKGEITEEDYQKTKALLES